jgi:hypothetical protein
VMLRVPPPPLASIIGGALSETAHLTGLGPVLTVEDPHPDTSTATSSATPAVSTPRRPTQALPKGFTAGLGIQRRGEQEAFQRVRAWPSALYRKTPLRRSRSMHKRDASSLHVLRRLSYASSAISTAPRS